MSAMNRGAVKRIFIGFLSIFFCSPLFAEIYPVENSTANICILAYDTEFKRSLTAALVQEFNSKGISVTVDSVSNRGKYSSVDYDAVILLSGVKAGKPLSGAIEYIKKNNYSSNIVYVFTHGKSNKFPMPYGRGDKVLDKNKIDAVTSASIAKNDQAFEEVKNKIIEKVMEVLGKSLVSYEFSDGVIQI